MSDHLITSLLYPHYPRCHWHYVPIPSFFLNKSNYFVTLCSKFGVLKIYCHAQTNNFAVLPRHVRLRWASQRCCVWQLVKVQIARVWQTQHKDLQWLLCKWAKPKWFSMANAAVHQSGLLQNLSRKNMLVDSASTLVFIHDVVTVWVLSYHF